VKVFLVLLFPNGKKHPTPILRHISRKYLDPRVLPSLYHHARTPIPPLYGHLLMPRTVSERIPFEKRLYPHPNLLARRVTEGTVIIHPHRTPSVARIQQRPIAVHLVHLAPFQHPATPTDHILLVSPQPMIIERPDIFLIPDMPTVWIPPKPIGGIWILGVAWILWRC